MIFDVALDFANALAAMPREHPKRRTLELFEEAIRRDIHFIERHPTTLFQCMWNLCWWYDCAAAATQYDEPKDGWPSHLLPLPWTATENKLSDWMMCWRMCRSRNLGNYFSVWVRSCYPPVVNLGAGPRASIEISGHVTDIAFGPNSDFAVVSSVRRRPDSSMLHVVPVSATAAALSIPILESCAESLAVLPGSRRVAAGCDDGLIRVFDIDTGDRVITLQTGSGRVIDLCVDSVSCTLIAICSTSIERDGVRTISSNLQQWDMHEWAHLDRFNLPTSPLCFAHDHASGRAVCGSASGQVCLLERQTEGWRLLANRNGHGLQCFISTEGEAPVPSTRDTEVLSIGFSPNGEWVWSAGEDGKVNVWTRDGLTLERRICDAYGPGWASHAAISPEGHRLAVLHENGALRVFDFESGTLRFEVIAHEGQGKFLAWSPDGSIIATAGEGEVRLWNSNVEGGQRTARVYSGKPKGRFSLRIEGRTATSAPWEKEVFWIDYSAQVNSPECPNISHLELLKNEHETVLRNAGNRKTVGWFPIPLRYLNVHPHARILTATGAHSSYEYCIGLECDVDRDGSLASYPYGPIGNPDHSYVQKHAERPWVSEPSRTSSNRGVRPQLFPKVTLGKAVQVWQREGDSEAATVQVPKENLSAECDVPIANRHRMKVDEVVSEVSQRLIKLGAENAITWLRDFISSHTEVQRDPRIANALAVCFLRSGAPEKAAQVLAPLVLRTGDIRLRANTSLVFRINYATALLMNGDIPLAADYLRDFSERESVQCVCLYDVLSVWEKRLPLLKRLFWRLFRIAPKSDLPTIEDPGEFL